jgi:hypothetical protein
MTWTTEDSLAMVRHYLGYEIEKWESRWYVRKGEDRPLEPLPHFPDDREEMFRCLEAWIRYHPGGSIGIAWTDTSVIVRIGDGLGVFTPTLMESLLRMLLAEALAAEENR